MTDTDVLGNDSVGTESVSAAGASSGDKEPSSRETPHGGDRSSGRPGPSPEDENEADGEDTSSELADAKAESARLKDLWMRSVADFDNFRKRSRREVDDARKVGREEFLKEMLPVFDNLERGIKSAERAQDVKSLSDGLTMILKQFETTLGRLNITRVPTVGTAFDPTVHEAIQQVETDEHPPGTVVAEVQSGYVQGEKLARAAMVVVAKPKSVATGDAS